jgi:hypothetical protein
MPWSLPPIEAGVPSLVEARTHIDQLYDMIRKKDEANLDAWIANAKASLVSSFATGVLKDTLGSFRRVGRKSNLLIRELFSPPRKACAVLLIWFPPQVATAVPT